MTLPNLNNKPFHGFGIGLRSEYYQELLDTAPALDWLEIISENYLVAGGKPLYFLDQFNERYPLAMHGVSMNLGSTDPLNFDYLNQLKQLALRVNPIWISDHCCWTGVNQENTHDLLPLPYREDTVRHIAQRIKDIQDFLERPILIENLSSYVDFKESEMSEWQFLSAICQEANCYLLLDINNIYVSARNHGFTPRDYLEGIPKERVLQHHLAGHSDYGDYIIDTHDAPICDEVFELYRQSIQYFGPTSTLIERDDHFPPLSELLAELEQTRAIFKQQWPHDIKTVTA